MPNLWLSLFGPFQPTLDGQPIVGFASNKVRALLAYLAVEADWPHARDELIGLLWPDQPDTTARANLRQALANLRQVIGDRASATPFLTTTSDSIQFQRTQQCSIDVVAFTELLAACHAHVHRRLETCRSCAQRLQQAAELYRGDFLAQFVQSGGEAFEEWVLIKRESLHRDTLDALHHLTQHFEWRGDYTQALRFAQRQLELDPWREEAHRQAMRALALSGQRSVALAQYETCRRVLAQELGAEPAEETVALYEQIKVGAVVPVQQQWLTSATPLIGRESELAEANAIWHRARAGEGQVLLISGEPGIGKTRLLHELMAQERYGNATILLGECYAEGSAPFAPIAQAIQAAFSLPLSVFLPTGEGLGMGVIADLITFVPALHDRFPNVQPNLPLEPQAEQQRRFDSVASFFAALAARTPVLLIIEDAHWADSATLTLLRHIARRLRLARVLIVATHREAALDETRLFREWLDDLQRERLATSIHLLRLDKERTRDLLAAIFREAITPEFLDGIFNATEGNPFFVAEVCQALIDGGAVYREGGQWQRISMTQIQIPRSLRLAIQRRVDRLPEATQDTLQRAAVLGREFEFDVLQVMSDLSEDALIDALDSAERAQLIAEVKDKHDATYTFVHALIPSALVDGLSGVRRQRLHKRAAQALERVHADRLDELAAQLGRHYAKAGDGEKAVGYLLQAGDHARSVYAYDEAIDHYRQALTFLKEQGPVGLTRTARTAMNLGTLHHTLFDFERARRSFQEAFDLWQRARRAQGQASLPPAPHALRLPWVTVDLLDPALISDNNLTAIAEQLFSGLVELSPESDLEPALARAWELSDDGRRYVFHLRRDAAWSDGVPVTAHDFEFAWKRVLQPATASANAEYLYDIQGAKAFHQGQAPHAGAVGVRALDDFTLRVDLEEPAGYFLHLLTNVVTGAVPQHVVETHGATWSTMEHIVTNGPFRLDTWRPGETIVLTRNPTYFGVFGGNLAQVELTLSSSSQGQIQLQRYLDDRLDVCGLDDPDTIDRMRQQCAGEYRSLPEAMTIYMAFNTTWPPFDDVRVRQALAHAVDRRTLAEVVLRGAVAPAIGGFVPPGLAGHSPDIGLAYDPDRAQQLLAEAGFPDGRGFPLVEALASYSGEMWQAANRFVADQWRVHLGLSIEWQTMERTAFLKRLYSAAPLQLFRWGWAADYPDPDSFLRLGLHRPYYRWHSAKLEQLLETTRRLADPIERLKFYQAADRLVIEEAVVVPLSYDRGHRLLQPWVKRYPLSPLRANYWKDVIIEAH